MKECLGCERITLKQITLWDGRVVCNTCPDWILECDARTTLRMPTKEDRRRYLALVKEKRGTQACDDLIGVMMAIYNQDR